MHSRQWHVIMLYVASTLPSTAVAMQHAGKAVRTMQQTGDGLHHLYYYEVSIPCHCNLLVSASFELESSGGSLQGFSLWQLGKCRQMKCKPELYVSTVPPAVKWWVLNDTRIVRGGQMRRKQIQCSGYGSKLCGLCQTERNWKNYLIF